MKPESDDTFGYGREFTESSKVIQKGFDENKSGVKARRERMISENPIEHLENKVDSITKVLETLTNKLEKTSGSKYKEY